MKEKIRRSMVNLKDLISGYRNSLNEEEFLESAFQDVKKELKNADFDIKANALLKLIYMQTLGFPMEWASFQIVQIMSVQKFEVKRIAYLASMQCLQNGNEVIMLMTNMFKKDLCSSNPFEIGLALQAVSHLITREMAMQIGTEIHSLLNHTKVYVRKRALAALFKFFSVYPESIPDFIDKLKDLLQDKDQGVANMTVSLFCELCYHNQPKKFLILAPVLFNLLVNANAQKRNNWICIKFGMLCPEEPRLGKKLSDPIYDIVENFASLSLVHECIKTVSSAHGWNSKLQDICLQKIDVFLRETDPNLKYTALLSLFKLVSLNPEHIEKIHHMVLPCTSNEDPSIRLLALELISKLISRNNSYQIIQKLLQQLPNETEFNRDTVVLSVLKMGKSNGYEKITNFEWYFEVLVKFCEFEGVNNGEEISFQLVDLCVRVREIQSFASSFLIDYILKEPCSIVNCESNIPVLSSMAWIIGEYYDTGLDQEISVRLLKLITLSTDGLFARDVVKFSIVNASVKILSKQYGNEAIVQSVVDGLKSLYLDDTEILSQSQSWILCKLLEEGKLYEEISSRREELLPVNPKAQGAVAIPKGLDLDIPFTQTEIPDEREEYETIAVDEAPTNTTTTVDSIITNSPPTKSYNVILHEEMPEGAASTAFTEIADEAERSKEKKVKTKKKKKTEKKTNKS